MSSEKCWEKPRTRLGLTKSGLYLFRVYQAVKHEKFDSEVRVVGLTPFRNEEELVEVEWRNGHRGLFRPDDLRQTGDLIEPIGVLKKF